MIQGRTDKLLVWLHGEIKTPPFTELARVEAGVLLRRLQRGELLGLPHSRPMPAIGQRCHELRVPDKQKTGESFTLPPPTPSCFWIASSNRPSKPHWPSSAPASSASSFISPSAKRIAS